MGGVFDDQFKTQWRHIQTELIVRPLQQQKFGHPGLLGHPPPPSPPLASTAGLSSPPGAKNNNNNTISPTVRPPPGGSPTNSIVPNFQDVRARLPFPVPGASQMASHPGHAGVPSMSPLQAQGPQSRQPSVSQASPRSNSYPDEPMSPNGEKV